MRSIVTSIAICLLIPNSLAVAYPNKQQQTHTALEKKVSKTNNNEGDREPLDFSGTGRPGQQTAGESRGNCVSTDRDLEAIIPTSHSGKTVSGHPRFWVYFPYTSKQVSHVEFIVQNEEREDLWRSRSKIDNNAGYKSFSIPPNQAPLEVGQWYRWYVKVYCHSQTASAQYVQGWVNRIPLTSKLYLELQQKSRLPHRIYGNHGIWYDAIDKLLNLYQDEPKNIALQKDWQNLIRAKGVRLQRLPQLNITHEAVK